MKQRFGIIGLLVGLLAIGTAIFQNDLRAAFAPPEPSFTEVAKEAGKKLLEEKILRKPPSEAPRADLKQPHDRIALIYMGLGFLAIILGVASWVKKDHVRISGGAVALGLVAVAWQYVLIGVIIAAIIFVLANLG